MLTFEGKGTSHQCDGSTRRDFLQVGTLGAIGFSLADCLAAEAAMNKKNEDRACIMIFNLGAPSHIDLFDMKPEAAAEVRGPFKPIDTASSEIQISELLPMHAKIADKFSIVRSAHHKGAAVHDSGWQMMQTGRQFTGGVNSPHTGSVVSYLKGRRTDLPPFVVLPELMGRGGGGLPNGQAAGFLGKSHDPFVLNANPAEKNFQVPDLLPPKEISSVRLSRRKKMREIVDETVNDFEASENAALLDENFASAFRLMTSKQARKAFDLSKEPMEVRERYGMNRFGQCCLLSRRLVDAGVRFVTINTFLTVFNEVTWDIHGSKPFTSIEGMQAKICPMYDQAYSALIEDLADRGMLDSTMVCNLAEFGRTPRVNPAGGRDHWPQCFSVYFAGGGVRGGQIVGASDPIGGVPADRPVEPADIVATIYRSLGLDPQTILPGPGGRPYPLVDQGHHPIHELF